MIAGCISWIAFLIWELKFAKIPVFSPIHQRANRTAIYGILALSAAEFTTSTNWLYLSTLLASDPPNISWLSYVAWPWLLRRTHCAPAGCGLADDENENVAPVPMDWCRLDDSGRRSAYSSPLANLERWINCYLGDCSRFRCWYDLRPTHRCHSKRCSTPRFVNLLFVFN